MRVLTFFFLCVLMMAPAGSALAQAKTQAEGGNPTPLGLWLTENERSVIEVHPCKGDSTRLCGRIHWIIEGGMQFDSKNPDAARHKTPMCGLEILSGFRQQDDRNWGDGKIYKADEGDTYNANLQILPNGKMIVRGYIGMPLFGKSQTWTRVTGTQHKKCTPAKG